MPRVEGGIKGSRPVIPTEARSHETPVISGHGQDPAEGLRLRPCTAPVCSAINGTVVVATVALVIAAAAAVIVSGISNAGGGVGVGLDTLDDAVPAKMINYILIIIDYY